MAEEILGCYPEDLMLLEMSFMLWGYQAGHCFQGSQETPWPPFQTQQSLVDPATRRQVEERAQC